ncbi:MULTISPECIES: hypothetical protein [Clostridium]|uniref:Uncharacterized protein n=1 Tax=Clostridium frigoriphilum TaxID=443253 RepID=A0ABU7UVM3_9CLOT|nr:hypothetical protein [Clostridium sp. DSM 17811]MBU3102304.1 hypothetical protein [Clostridium sp. DSM 17811]
MIECLKDFYALDNIFNTSNNTNYKFENLVGLNNYECIHPVKQRKVYEIANLLLKDNVGKHITDIIVFGSATTLFCSSFSDMENNNFYKNAWVKGVRVYEQLSVSC